MVDVPLSVRSTHPVPLMQPSRVEGDLLVVAGEASGDLHGARLLTELKQLAPKLRYFGVGGEELRAAGMQLIANSSEISVVGITEVVRILPRARQIFRQVLSEVDRRQTRIALLIDFPDFNLRLAKQLARRGVRVLYYISPQIWAWRRGRVHTIERVVDRMLVILPFEVDFYRGQGVEAIEVGHPLVDEVPVRSQRWDSLTSADGPFKVALLPGSRASEIKANLPVMLAAAARMRQRVACDFELIKAPTISDRDLEGPMAESGVELKVVRSDRFAAVAGAHLAICASGTATLEVGLLGTPMIMVYRVSTWTYLLGRLLVRLPHIALVNLVLEDRVVPELIQGEANPENIADIAVGILSDRDRIQRMRKELGILRSRLGESGASRRAANQVFKDVQTELTS